MFESDSKNISFIYSAKSFFINISTRSEKDKWIKKIKKNLNGKPELLFRKINCFFILLCLFLNFVMNIFSGENHPNIYF
jgi:hypothetical protein